MLQEMPSIPVFALVTPPVSAFISASLSGRSGGDNGEPPGGTQARSRNRLKGDPAPSQARCVKPKLFRRDGEPGGAGRAAAEKKRQEGRFMKAIMRSCALAAALAL